MAVSCKETCVDGEDVEEDEDDEDEVDVVDVVDDEELEFDWELLDWDVGLFEDILKHVTCVLLLVGDFMECCWSCVGWIEFGLNVNMNDGVNTENLTANSW